jgi:2-oxo-3-hexenedioate decarboxylase
VVEHVTRFASYQDADASIHPAETILAASDQRRHIAPLTERDGSFGPSDAYRATKQVRRLRETRGDKVVGRRIGFTNTTIWADYNVAARIWGYV